MTVPLILALLVLLLPIPLSFLIPASVRASPDPWRVARARKALIFFALFVAVVYLLPLAFAPRLRSGSPVEAEWQAAQGLFGWAMMSWFFFGVVAWELRRGKPDPLRGEPRRGASLVPRHRGSRSGPRWWAVAGVAWLFAAGAMWALAPARDDGGMLLVLLASGALLAAGPSMARRSALDAEPLPTEAPDRLVSLYARRRRSRSTATASIVVVTVLSQTLVAAAIGWSVDPVPVLVALLAALGAILLVYLQRELALARDIRSAAKGGGEGPVHRPPSKAECARRPWPEP